VFSTSRYCEYTLGDLTAPSFPKEKFPDLQSLWIAVVRMFSPAALAICRADSEDGKTPKEDAYQKEFYRAMCVLMGEAFLVSSEWTGKGSNGSVDFRIPSQKWAIEALRDGSKLNEHINRFKPRDLLVLG
jgi:hypothetical protein